MTVVDDGSTDGSADIIKSYIPKFKKRGYNLEYVYQKNQGQSVAINNALKIIKGDYLVWPDADDYYSSVNTIKTMVDTLDKTGDDTSMVRVEYNIANEDGNIIGKHEINDDTLYKTDLFEDAVFGENGFWYPPGGYMAKTSILDKVIPGRNIYMGKKAGQNFQLYLPLLYRHKIITIQEKLYTIISHPESHSRKSGTFAERQQVYLETIQATINNIDIDKDYKKYLLSKVNRVTQYKIQKTSKNQGFRYAVKRVLKALMPYGAIVVLRKKGILAQPPEKIKYKKVGVKKKTKLDWMSEYDDSIFKKGFAQEDFSKENIEGWMLFCAHVLEKSMSRVDFEAGHNFFRIEQMANLLADYRKKGFDEGSFAFQYALASIKKYVELHEEYSFSTKEIYEVLGEWVDEARSANGNLSGYKIITSDEKKNNKEKNFLELHNGRYSIREFSSKKVDKSVIEKSIQLAMKAPAVCNRQPSRVHLIMDKDKISEILSIQGGFAGYDMPPALLLVSVDTRSYVGAHERNQPFMDGGAFAMSLLLSLEYCGLAACALNTMFKPDRDRKMREIIGITNPEYFIMFIAVGHFNKESKVAVSSRLLGKEITTEYL